MTHAGAWYVKPSNNIAADFTPTWSVGTPDTDFPLANVLTLEPDVVAKANENTATLRLTAGVAKTLVGLAYINVSFPGISVALTNNGGMATQNATVADPEDDLQISVFFDLTAVSGTTATQWNLAVVGSSPIAVGTVVPILAIDEFRMRWEYELADVFPAVKHYTSYHKLLQYWIPVRYRKFQGVPFYASDIEGYRTLRREAHGSITPWLFVLDGEPMLVQFASDEHVERHIFYHGDPEGVIEHPIALEEVNAGVSLL